MATKIAYVHNQLNKTVNPIGYYNPDKEKYIRLWSNYDFNQCISRYVWDGLPNGLKSWWVERMLYFRGSLVGFMLAGKFHLLPFTIVGNLSRRGTPTKVMPIAYNGESISKEFELDIDVFGNENEDYKGVLLYDMPPVVNTGVCETRAGLNYIIIKEIADTFARININVVVSNKKILLEIKDAKQKEIVEHELRTIFGSDCPFGVITAPLQTSSVQSSSDFNADELFNTIKNYDAVRCFMSGISSKSFGTEKKERLITGELNGMEEEKDLILDLGLEMRKEFCEMVNSKFGLNISVKKRNENYEKEVDGNGNTFEENNGGV